MQENKLSTFCTEVAQFLESLFKMMLKNKQQKELTGYLADLFDWNRPSKQYMIMICHTLESIPATVLKKAILIWKDKISNGKYSNWSLGYFMTKLCIEKYQKTLMNDQLYNKAILAVLQDL